MFAENVQPAAMYGVFFNADGKFNGVTSVKFQVFRRDARTGKRFIDEHSVFRYGEGFKYAKLCGSNRPVFGRIFATPSAEVAGRGESRYFNVVYRNGYIAWPVVVVLNRFRTYLERKRYIVYFTILGFGEVVTYKPRVEP